MQRTRGRVASFPALALGILAVVAPAAGQDESPGLRRGALALVEFLAHESANASEFLEAHVADALRERVEEAELEKRLAALRRALLGASLDDRFPDGEHGSCLVYLLPGGGSAEVVARFEPAPPHGLVDLWIEGGEHLDPAVRPEPLPPPLTWESLAQRMQQEAAGGFAGVLLVVRDGATVLNEAWGLANREKGIANTPETIFAIGSTPIDFTKAAILLLDQDEILDLDQPITDFFEDVPADKRAITVRHLMTGGSGLQDFLGLPTDTDPDHFWIDRAEAVRRIFAQTLLFEPGRGRQHSHAAWGLLAAIVEIASETSYRDFTRELLFEPAGMTSTGFFGDPIDEQRCAVGYGMLRDGEVNVPPFWGPTSWLVLGSGGMVSTTGDMLRWLRTVRAGKILGPQAQALYWGPPGGVLAGGDVFGFEILYTEGPDTLFVLISNGIDASNRRRFNRLGKDLARLISSPGGR